MHEMTLLSRPRDRCAAAVHLSAYVALAFICLASSASSSGAICPEVATVEGRTCAGVRTRAVLLARLIERVQEEDEAYLVFEKLRTLRGRDSRGLLAFSHPTLRLPGPPVGRTHTQEHLSELQKGRAFLLLLVGTFRSRLTCISLE